LVRWCAVASLRLCVDALLRQYIRLVADYVVQVAQNFLEIPLDPIRIGIFHDNPPFFSDGDDNRPGAWLARLALCVGA
jgi:hypothetical protein